MKMPASKTALMCFSQPELSRPSRKSDMEGERSSHTVSTTQLSHWQETRSIPDHCTLLNHIHFRITSKVHDNEFLRESVHDTGKHKSFSFQNRSPASHVIIHLDPNQVFSHARDMAVGMEMPVSQTGHHFGLDSNIATTTE